MTTTNIGACGCCVQGPQCCCDGTNFRVLAAGEECTGSQFNRPNSVPNISLVFEWCGLTAERTLQGGLDSYYATQNVNFKVCDTNGRYGEGGVSYTQATRKALSVYIFPNGGGGYCGYKQKFIVGASFEGVGYAVSGEDRFAVEPLILTENYACSLYQCFDGSEAVVTMTTSNEGPEGYGFSTDDSCGEAGNFEPCKFTAPELTVIGAP